MTYHSAWWSVDLPSNWTGFADAECATFHADPTRGTLQISAARKDHHAVQDIELREFAEDRLGLNVPLEQVKFGSFSGFTARYRKDDLFWQEWWLGCGQLLVYATYNVVQGSETSEEESLLAILGSLSPIGHGL